MKRALIVDDSAENLYLLRALLQGNGFEVAVARHGAEALTRARQAPPDVVISDLLMPVMDGYALLRRWKTDDALKAVPFIVYTATYTDPRDEQLALDLGADAFLIKPAEPEPIMACVREVLARAGRDGYAPRAARLGQDALQGEYNEALVRKLERKVRQLEDANRELLQEIAERQRAEAALRLRDRAIQAVSQGILITDPNQPDNPIIFAGAGFERMTGYPPAEVLGKNGRFLQGQDTDPAAVALLRAAVAAGRGAAVEVLNYRKDGAPFWNQLSVSPVLGPDGRLTHFVGVLTDVTERHRLEQQLRQAQKMEAFGQLAGGVAHDFNNLLTVISGFSEMLLATLPPGDAKRESVKAISEAAARAASLTRQLLTFSRRTVRAPVVLDVNEAVHETEKLLRRLIGEDVRLTAVLYPRAGPIKVDAGSLGQVLMNLAVNARDAMPRGGKLTIETANVTRAESDGAPSAAVPPGNYVLLAVSDTGCGIAPDILPRVFEPFFTTKGDGKGTGLGLALVHGIVKQSGGHIEVESAPGRGTTFRLYFPAVPDAVRQPAAPAGDGVAPGTETVLLVEDEESVRGLAVLALQTHGYTVLAAGDGEDALRLADRHGTAIALLVTDVVLPGLGGGDLAQTLAVRFPGLKVLFLSGYTDDAMVRHGIQHDTVAFLQKPFSPRGLARKVREVLDA